MTTMKPLHFVFITFPFFCIIDGSIVISAFFKIEDRIPNYPQLHPNYYESPVYEMLCYPNGFFSENSNNDENGMT